MNNDNLLIRPTTDCVEEWLTADRKQADNFPRPAPVRRQWFKSDEDFPRVVVEIFCARVKKRQNLAAAFQVNVLGQPFPCLCITLRQLCLQGVECAQASQLGEHPSPEGDHNQSSDSP